MNLLYDDGERETRVSLSLVCHRGARGNASPGSDSVSDSDSDAGDEAGESSFALKTNRWYRAGTVLVQ